MNSNGPFQLIVYAKNPLPGRVKTRLAAGSNQRLAVRAYQSLVDKTFALRPNGIAVTVAASPDFRHTYLRRAAQRHQRKIQLQPRGDLGQRMRASIRQSITQGYRGCIIVGTDCPMLSEHDLEQAVTALSHTDVYLLPARDGGYALIGCRGDFPAIFRQVNWSTPQLLKQTQRQIRAAGLSLRLGRTVSDVDEYPEWKKARKLNQVAPLWRRRSVTN